MEPKELHIEWQSLRGEILELDKACLTILQYGLILSGASIGFIAKHLSDENVTVSAAIQSSNSLMITLILLSGIWILAYNYLYHKRLSSRRIASYLRFFVESKSFTPKWETRVQSFRDIRSGQAGINTELIEMWISLLVQGVIFIISMCRLLFSVFRLFKEASGSFTPWVWGVGLSSFGVLFSLGSIIFTIRLYKFLKRFNSKEGNQAKFETAKEIWKEVWKREELQPATQRNAQ